MTFRVMKFNIETGFLRLKSRRQSRIAPKKHKKYIQMKNNQEKAWKNQKNAVHLYNKHYKYLYGNKSEN